MLIGFIELDRDAAEQVALALHVHARSLRARGLVVPPALDALCKAALEASRRGQDESGAVSRRPVPQSAEWMTRECAAELVGVSESTIGRLIRDGVIPSTKLGRLRRIRRADLETFLQRKGTDA